MESSGLATRRIGPLFDKPAQKLGRELTWGHTIHELILPQPPADHKGQVSRVKAYMRGRGWVTLYQVASGANVPESTVGSRIRDLRKPRYGGHIVNKQPARANRPWRYKLEDDK